MLNKFLILLLLINSISIASPFNKRLDYNTLNITSDYNIIIFVNQLNTAIETQPVLFSLLNKVPNKNHSFSLQQIVELLPNHQLFISTYRLKTELNSPEFNRIHQYRKYPLRFNKYSLYSERKIIADTFNSLDDFVRQEKTYRPICLIIDLPAKVNYSLIRHASNDTSTFESRRDFSLVNLYHEIHKRRYLVPNKVIILNDYSSGGLIIENF